MSEEKDYQYFLDNLPEDLPDDWLESMEGIELEQKIKEQWWSLYREYLIWLVPGVSGRWHSEDWHPPSLDEWRRRMIEQRDNPEKPEGRGVPKWQQDLPDWFW